MKRVRQEATLRRCQANSSAARARRMFPAPDLRFVRAEHLDHVIVEFGTYEASGFIVFWPIGGVRPHRVDALLDFRVAAGELFDKAFPSTGQSLSSGTRGVFAQAGFDIGVKFGPVPRGFGLQFRGPEFLAFPDVDFGVVAELLPFPVGNVLHFELLDDELKQFPIRIAVGIKRTLGVIDRGDGLVELMALREQGIALFAQDVLEPGVRLEQPSDLFQRNAEEFENHDLLEAREIVGGIEAVTGARTLPGAQEPQLIVVVQRTHGDTGELGKFAGLEELLGSLIHG